MDDLIDMMVADKSANDVSDKIKEILYAKSAEKIEKIRPDVANQLFTDAEPEETTDELESDVDSDQESEEEEEVSQEDPETSVSQEPVIAKVV